MVMVMVVVLVVTIQDQDTTQAHMVEVMGILMDKEVTTGINRDIGLQRISSSNFTKIGSPGNSYLNHKSNNN